MTGRQPHASQPHDPQPVGSQAGILVLGLGNTILQDEGLGVIALERLVAEHPLPPHVKAVEGSIMGLDLLPFLDGVSDLLVLDAVQTNQPPGTLVRLEGAELQGALSVKMSMHQFGLQELLAVAAFQGTLPPKVVVWGMEPASLATGCELSPLAKSRLPALVEAAAGELRAWLERVPIATA